MKKLIFTLIGITMLPLAAFAGVEHLNLQKCDLGIHPYNPSATALYGPAGTAQINFPGETICANRTPYGQPYHQPPVISENPLKTGADGKNVPDAEHIHTYVNSSLQDNYYYLSYMDRFEIKLQSDTLTNTDLNKVQCVTPAPSDYTGNANDLMDCNGQANDLYGGTKVSFNKSTGIITWQFGVNDLTQRPERWGNNPGLNSIISSITGESVNLSNTNDFYRKFNPSVYLSTKNNNGEIWSATTTSRILIRNYAILKSSVNTTAPNYGNFNEFCSTLGDFTKWCPLATPTGQGYSTVQLGNSGQQQWFWYPIGSVVTVWMKASTPSTLACADLQWDGAFKKPGTLGIYFPDTVNPNALLPDEKAIMKFKTIYENGTGTKRPLEYRWVAFYGDQNRPTWFINEDKLFGVLVPIGEQFLVPMLQSSLPARLLQIAHAAPAPAAGSSGSSPSLAAENAGLEAAQQATTIKIGDFKDEISALLSGNPLTDDDNQIYYSSGSEGVTVGVQAYYTDGKYIEGDGPQVRTEAGSFQKAPTCHLEMVIQPKPATCIDLSISPSTLAPNTPVTFTVTPKFLPANKSIPLNYHWSSEKYTSAIGQLGLGNLAFGMMRIADPDKLQFIPGATNDTQDPTWFGTGMAEVSQTGGGLANIADPCFWGNCDTVEQTLLPIDPSGPIEQTSVGNLAGQAVGSTFTNAQLLQMIGANVFTDFDTPTDYGQAAVFNAGALYASPTMQNAADLKKVSDAALLPMALSYGGFKDAQSSPGLGANPFLETTDNKTYYTGGPENTLIKVQAEGKDGTLYPPCNESLIIPPVPGAICEQLKVNFYDGSTLVQKADMVAGKTYRIAVDKANSVKDDGTPITKYTVVAYNPAGVGALTAATTNTASCTPITTLPVINPGAEIAARGTQTSTSVDCQYLYTPNINDKITMLADPHDNVAACRLDQVIPGSTNLCELLSVKFYEGDKQVRKEQMVADKTYTIEIDQANSVRDDGSPITKYIVAAYNPDGVGQMTADSGNAPSCSAITDIPLGDPDLNGPIIARGTKASTSVACKYVYRPNAGDKITLLADPHDNVAACRVDQTIPSVPTGPICKSLNLQTAPTITGNEIAQGQIVAFATNAIDTEDKPRPPVVYSETGSGYFVANPANAPVPDCPAVPASGTFEVSGNSCRYSYQAPTDGTSATVSIKVKQDDGVADCIQQYIVKPTEKEICLALNLRVNGQYTLNPQIVAGQSYALQVDPVTTQGQSIPMVEWTTNGNGKLIGQPSNPAICPTVIDNGSAVTLSVCRYIFASAPNAQNVGFSVKAVPDDNVAACKASAQNYQPPVIPPYCLYLDLDYTPEPFQTIDPTNMNATVVMSDSSKYADYVRFTSTNGFGQFSGGTGGTSGSGTNNFRTQTDSTNNTRTVNYKNGNQSSGVNVYLSDTNIRMSAACMRQLRPVIRPPSGCDYSPTIRHKDNNRYCAEDGDSESYCWTINGPGNDLLFTNGRNTATGDCVELNQSYERFELLVEDCNPLYKDICYDTLTNNEEIPKTPTIEKRISKASPLHFTTAVHFSTTGESEEVATPETVEYKLTYIPANFEGDNNTMTARIYDPAFSGTITGVKTHVDGHTEEGGTITFDLPGAISITGYPFCSGSASLLDKCYRIVSDSPTNSYLEIQGIDSTAPITITYQGKLYTDISIDDCREGVWCNEEFRNQSRVDDLQYCVETTDENGISTVNCTPIDTPIIYSNTTIADVVCSYFLTRASGDVFLEKDDLVYGVDVSKCYPYKNVSSTIVTPIDEIGQLAPSTGGETQPTIISISHEICSAGQADFNSLDLTPDQIDALSALYGSGIVGRLSSQICEVGLVPGSDWDKTSIAAAMDQNIKKLTRWDSGVPTGDTLISAQEIKDNGGVYYFKGQQPGNTLTINGLQIPEDSGALTIIVEDADLQINGDIVYSPAIEGQPATAQDIASLGVIVLNGNMYVENSVQKLAGAYFVQRTGDPNDPNTYLTGNILAGQKGDTEQNSTYQLTINGSVYGNIGPLFFHRVAAGDIAADEGSVTIRYDQRIIQNPPAGLTDLLGNFSQTQIAQ